MMKQLLYIGIGGASGSIIRYLLQRHFNVAQFPYGTLLVNLTGCFAIGLLAALLLKNGMNEPLKALLITGFCGGFTTFSAFTMEGNNFLVEGKWLLFILYTTISVAGGLFFTFLGYKLFQA
jgi:CrcB protein